MDRGTAAVGAHRRWSGGLIALQAPINSHARARRSGRFQAALVSFAIGTVAAARASRRWRSGGLGQIGEARHVSWYYLIGGLLGAAYVCDRPRRRCARWARAA